MKQEKRRCFEGFRLPQDENQRSQREYSIIIHREIEKKQSSEEV